jgi:hypothetical protein
MPARTAPKTFECALCSAALVSQRELDNHLCLVHDECGEAHLGSPITFRCATCGEAFTRRSDLYAHMSQRDHGHPSTWDKAGLEAQQRRRRRPPRTSG